ncbi:MAG: hypothetical protein A2234_04735 [Elusimicrobia bacterium RIFOXYA2_FULL_58_8]|nr:MAG: hypothetical protein A2285_08995 [Elusimicrobia bacterium RIFOXYA12_FULL_57_11]OGS13612.1 MAG: hypothetical protein A2234_04735 [Elusimicrobia bacterium RIFOXYA2_FULL_58_8]
MAIRSGPSELFPGFRDSAYPRLGYILLFGALLRLWCFNAMTGYDEFIYAHLANNLAQGVLQVGDASGYFSFRYLLYAPAAFFVKLFGLSAFSLSLWPFLCSMGNICAAFLLGRLFFGPGSAILSAFLCAFFPFSVTYGTILYPEEIISFLLGLSVYFYFRADRTEESNAASGFFVLSGIFAALAYYTRLNALLVFGFYGVYAAFRPARMRFLWVPAGFLLALLPEALFYYFKIGDPFYSWHSQHQMLISSAVRFSSSLRIYLEAIFGLNMYGLSLFGFFYHFFSAALVYFSYQRKFRDILPLFLWFACLFAYLEFGPSDMGAGRYVLALKQLRFLSMVSLPVCLVVAVFISRLEVKTRIGLLAFLLISSVAGGLKMSEYCAAQAAPHELAYAYMKESAPGAVFVPGADWTQRLNFYFKTPLAAPYYPKTGQYRGVRKLGELPGSGALKNSWLVVDTRELPEKGSKPVENAIKKAAKVININGFIRLYYVH